MGPALTCSACGEEARAVLCPSCWGLLPYEARLEFVQAETRRLADPDTYELATALIVYEGVLAYRMTILHRLWKRKWRKRFEAKYGPVL